MSNQRTDYINRFMQPGQPLERTPLVLIIDISWSMEAIRTILNEAITELLKQMKENKLLRGSIDLLVIHFNGESKVVVDFTPLEDVKVSDITIKECSGCTDTGTAISTALDMAYEYRDKLYDETDGYITPNQPLVFLLTDGIPDAGKKRKTDTDKEYQEAVDAVNQAYKQATEYIKEKEKNKKIVFIAAGINHNGGVDHNSGREIPGSNVSRDRLKELTNFPDRVITFKGDKTNFASFCKDIITGTSLVVANEEVNDFANL